MPRCVSRRTLLHKLVPIQTGEIILFVFLFLFFLFISYRGATQSGAAGSRVSPILVLFNSFSGLI